MTPSLILLPIELILAPSVLECSISWLVVAIRFQLLLSVFISASSHLIFSVPVLLSQVICLVHS